MNIGDAIKIDFNSEIMYGDDQAFVTYPCRFATVGVVLYGTDDLYQIADSMRKERGYLPMFWYGGDEPYDQTGWYNFYIGINDYSEMKVDSCIEFVVDGSIADDEGNMYHIELTQDEQASVYKALDKQCREHIGKSCEDLLAESRKELEELIEYEKRMGSI